MRGMQQELLGGDRRDDDDLRQYHDAVSPADLEGQAGGADRGNPGGDLVRCVPQLQLRWALALASGHPVPKSN